MKRMLLALALLLGLALPVAACLWDRDTPADEAKGMPQVVAVITGRFERNPPLFYEMRLERVAEHLRGHPDDLAAYDDAGVACDRLGRGDEAIAWMEKKRSAMEKLDPSSPEAKEHQYRYHANLGTFLVHRWARQGADRARLNEVRSARDEIAQALEINPRAHFGREAYQLRVLDWILNPPEVVEGQSLPNVLGWNIADIDGRETTAREADDAVKGLTGLVALGNAWESVDVFHALNVALQRDSVGFDSRYEGGRNSLAYLACLRARELVDAGRHSLLPGAPTGSALKAMLPLPGQVDPQSLLESTFRAHRAEADAWHQARTAFMLSRLQEGRHPDTDPAFWDGYTERPAPPLPRKSVPQVYNQWMAARRRRAWSIFLGVPAAVATVVIIARNIRTAKDRRKASIL